MFISKLSSQVGQMVKGFTRGQLKYVTRTENMRRSYSCYLQHLKALSWPIWHFRSFSRIKILFIVILLSPDCHGWWKIILDIVKRYLDQTCDVSLYKSFSSNFQKRIPLHKIFVSSNLQTPWFSAGHDWKHRPFSTTAAEINCEEGNEQKEKISVTFVDKDGEEMHIKVPIGMSMLEAAHENDIELEGACEGSLACSTCHVIVTDVNYYNKLEDPTDEENDMLDLAFGLTETSRLGCQVIAKHDLDGIRVALPVATRNFAVDGYVPKPH